jgi:hypothetical protein
MAGHTEGKSGGSWDAQTAGGSPTVIRASSPTSSPSPSSTCSIRSSGGAKALCGGSSPASEFNLTRGCRPPEAVPCVAASCIFSALRPILSALSGLAFNCNLMCFSSRSDLLLIEVIGISARLVLPVPNELPGVHVSQISPLALGRSDGHQTDGSIFRIFHLGAVNINSREIRAETITRHFWSDRLVVSSRPTAVFCFTASTGGGLPTVGIACAECHC